METSSTPAPAIGADPHLPVEKPEINHWVKVKMPDGAVGTGVVLEWLSEPALIARRMYVLHPLSLGVVLQPVGGVPYSQNLSLTPSWGW